MEAKIKNDQIIRETFQKLAQVILQARIVFPDTPIAQKKINKWFNLEIEELDSITHDTLSWQGTLQQGNQAPLYLEIYFSPTDALPQPDYSPLMERWKIVYQPSVGTTSIEFPTVYKHLVLLVRGVAGLLRVMPAFRAFRNCQRAKANRVNGTGAEIRYSFHASFPSSREFSPSRPTTEFMFDPVISPYGSLSVSVVYRNDCSVEIGATDPIIKAHFIKDYSPSDHALATSPPRAVYSQDNNPYRSAPIGIPGKDAPLETMMPMVSSPPSSLTMMSPGYLMDPSSYPPPQQNTPPNLPFRQNSLPNQYQLAQNPPSTSPVGIPFTSNRTPVYPAFSSSPTTSGSNSGFGQASAGSNYGHNAQGFNSTSSAGTNSTSTSNSSGSTGTNSHTNVVVNPSNKLRPRAASYAPPSAVVSPPSTTPPYSHSVYSRVPYSTSPPKDPYSTSPTAHSRSPTTYSHSPTTYSSSPLTSISPTSTLSQRPATNMYMSTLLGPSIHQAAPADPARPYQVPALEAVFEELAFASEPLATSKTSGHRLTAEHQIEIGEIGEFVRLCKSAPALNLFGSSTEKRIVGSSFLFADMTTSQIKNQLSFFTLTDSH